MDDIKMTDSQKTKLASIQGTSYIKINKIETVGRKIIITAIEADSHYPRLYMIGVRGKMEFLV